MDPIGDTLTTLLNAQRARKKRVAVPYSSFKKQLLELLVQQGKIASVRVQESPRAKLVVTLAYDKTTPRMAGAKRVSKPGRRLYTGHQDIPFTYSAYGFLVLSTPQGIMTEHEARKKRVGGELICAVW